LDEPKDNEKEGVRDCNIRGGHSDYNENRRAIQDVWHSLSVESYTAAGDIQLTDRCVKKGIGQFGINKHYVLTKSVTDQQWEIFWIEVANLVVIVPVPVVLRKEKESLQR
jgi:hypothetical protein